VTPRELQTGSTGGTHGSHSSPGNRGAGGSDRVGRPSACPSSSGTTQAAATASQGCPCPTARTGFPPIGSGKDAPFRRDHCRSPRRKGELPPPQPPPRRPAGNVHARGWGTFCLPGHSVTRVRWLSRVAMRPLLPSLPNRPTNRDRPTHRPHPYLVARGTAKAAAILPPAPVWQLCRSRPFEHRQGSNIWVQKKPLKPQCMTPAIGYQDFGFKEGVQKNTFSDSITENSSRGLLQASEVPWQNKALRSSCISCFGGYPKHRVPWKAVYHKNDAKGCSVLLPKEIFILNMETLHCISSYPRLHHYEHCLYVGTVLLKLWKHQTIYLIKQFSLLQLCNSAVNSCLKQESFY